VRVPIQRLYVVYNADSDWWSLLVDVARKLAGKDECPLCTLTHGATGERAVWKSCKQALRVPVDAVHRDELSGELRQIAALPYVAALVDGKPRVLLDSTVIAALRPEHLEQALRNAAAELGYTFPE